MHFVSPSRGAVRPEDSTSDRVPLPLLTLRAQEGESGSEVKGAFREENRSSAFLIFFPALDLGRPPSKVCSGCGGSGIGVIPCGTGPRETDQRP